MHSYKALKEMKDHGHDFSRGDIVELNQTQVDFGKGLFKQSQTKAGDTACMKQIKKVFMKFL